jgi:ribosomal protein S28E/S33
MRVRDGTRRTLFNRSVDGPVRVKDGVALKFGLKTPLLRKCE